MAHEDSSARSDHSAKSFTPSAEPAPAALRKSRNLLALPSQLHELIELIGFEPTLALVGAYGGREIEVPVSTTGTPAIRLGAIISDEAACTLIERMKGTRLYVPTGHAALVNERNMRIVKEIEEGASVFDVQMRYRISVRHIHRLCAAHGEKYGRDPRVVRREEVARNVPPRERRMMATAAPTMAERIGRLHGRTAEKAAA